MTTQSDDDRGVYGISVAAELTGTGAQNLRAYERRGLLEPDRTDGGTRRYSTNDVARARRIGELLDEGLNLAGVAKVLDLEEDNARLRKEARAATTVSAARRRTSRPQRGERRST